MGWSKNRFMHILTLQSKSSPFEIEYYLLTFDLRTYIDRLDIHSAYKLKEWCDSNDSYETYKGIEELVFDTGKNIKLKIDETFKPLWGGESNKQYTIEIKIKEPEQTSVNQFYRQIKNKWEQVKNKKQKISFRELGINYDKLFTEEQRKINNNLINQEGKIKFCNYH